MAVIGIDFGTEFSSVTAINKRGEFETIPDDQGKVRVSSCVSFHEDEMRVGNLADLKREVNVRNTIYDIKMLIGISLEKGRELKCKYAWPFDLINDGQGRMQVQVHYLKSVHKFYPEELVSILFRHLIEIAEKRLLQRKVHAAVISVATSFNHSQRKAIIDAARIAKLEVRALLNDTTAAAVYHAFMHSNRQTESQLTRVGDRIMVINIGAGTFSVSICDINKNSKVSIICSNGASSVGGRDITKDIFALLNTSYSTNVGLIRVLDQAKKDFSSSQRRCTTIDISIDGKMHRQEKISRKTYEEACKSLKRGLAAAINATLHCRSDRNYGVTKVILAGGSTRLPLVNELLASLNLLGKIEKTYVKTDEIVALGACITANEISKGNKLENIITEKLSYGVYNDCKKMLVMKDSPLPANHDLTASITKDLLKILDEDENTMLFAKIHPGFVPLRYILHIDENGLISVSSGDIKAVTDGLHKDKVEELKTNQIQLRDSDAKRKLAGEERYGLERAVLQIKKRCVATEKWLEDHQNSTVSDVRLKKQEFGTVLQHISEDQNMNFKNKSAKHVEHGACCDSRKKLRAEHLQIRNLQEEFKKVKSELEATIQKSEEEVNRVQENWKRRMTVRDNAIEDLEKQCGVLKEKLQRAYDANEKHKKSKEEVNRVQENWKRRMNVRDNAIKDLEKQHGVLKEKLQRAHDVNEKHKKSEEEKNRVQENWKRRMTVRDNAIKDLEKQCGVLKEMLQRADDANEKHKKSKEEGNRVQENWKRRMTVRDNAIIDLEKQCGVLKEKLQRAHDVNEKYKEQGDGALKELEEAQREKTDLKLKLQKSKEEVNRVQENWKRRMTVRDNAIKDLEKQCGVLKEKLQRAHDVNEKHKQQFNGALTNLREAKREIMELKSTLKKSKEEAKRVQGDLTSHITRNEKTIKELEKYCNYNKERWQRGYDAEENLKMIVQLKYDVKRRKEEPMIQDQLRAELEKSNLELKRKKEENLELQDKYESVQLQFPKKMQKTGPYGATHHLHNSRSGVSSRAGNRQSPRYPTERNSAKKRIGSSKEENTKLQDKSGYFRLQSTKKNQKTVPNSSQLQRRHAISRASSSVGNRQSPIYQQERYSQRNRIGSSKDKNESFRLQSSTRKQNTVSHGAQPHPPYSGSRASSTVGNGQRSRYQPERSSGTERTGSSRELRTRTVMGIY